MRPARLATRIGAGAANARARARGTILPIAAAALLAGVASARAANPPRDVLILYSYSRLVPANLEFEEGLRQSLEDRGGFRVEVFDEFLELPRFDGPEYLAAMEDYLREKYAARPPAVIIAAADEALRFLLERRASLFAGVPLVHVAVDRDVVDTLAPLPPDVIGVPTDFDFAGTIEQALDLHPGARRLIVVTGRGPRDRRQEARLRQDARRFESRVTVEFLAALPHRDVEARLGVLGSDSVVFTPGYFEDGDGSSFTPRETVRTMAATSTAPVYGIYSTSLGTGVVGGRVVEFDRVGVEAAREVHELLRGIAPASIELPAAIPSRLHLDWRQVRRFAIDERRIPADAVVQFRAPSFLEEHRAQLFGALALFSVQAASIGLLLIERRGRRAAEIAEQTVRIELTHASRLAIAGELLASIAHEINQPLGAILSNADAADMILDAGVDRTAELRDILADIRRDDLRASEVIRRLRTLLVKREVQTRAFDLAEAIREVELVLRPEARRRSVALDVAGVGSAVVLHGDRIQIQQVVINLVLNAMDAVAGNSEAERAVTVSLASEARGVGLRVRDTGAGIAAKDLPRLFDPFFTTKSQGMGLGLAISRTIVEAHGGRIRVDNDPGGGAVFEVELPGAAAATAPLPREGS